MSRDLAAADEGGVATLVQQQLPIHGLCQLLLDGRQIQHGGIHGASGCRTGMQGNAQGDVAHAAQHTQPSLDAQVVPYVGTRNRLGISAGQPGRQDAFQPAKK